ncbi:type VI protein secretion system component VasF [Nitrobacteraceae bacterium AZCC 1564]
MQGYKIKRAGREFVVYVGDSEILKCATKREAQKAISYAWHGPTGHSMTKKQSVSFGWILGGVLVLALALLYTYHLSNVHGAL